MANVKRCDECNKYMESAAGHVQHGEEFGVEEQVITTPVPAMKKRGKQEVCACCYRAILAYHEKCGYQTG